ncbi:MFS transporter, partial [Methylobacterium platani]|uniref:MFS transporter n=1 Tax=Methylobacterium platani TaxID=427683 RepID=UPI000A7FA559
VAAGGGRGAQGHGGGGRRDAAARGRGGRCALVVARPRLRAAGGPRTRGGGVVFGPPGGRAGAWGPRRPPPVQAVERVGRAGAGGTLGLPPSVLQGLLVVAGLACCVAMSMPQVHIVAYCGDLGYGVARGAEMLSLMLGFGIVSRVASGFLADRIGGLPTLLVGSVLQGVALLLYLAFDGLTSLYVISALFGLFQGGIVPAYAIIVRELFPASEAGGRVGVVIMATLFGMALGGWLSGVIFDLSGSYAAAFANGIGWNLLNVAIALWLVQRRAGQGRALPA